MPKIETDTILDATRWRILEWLAKEPASVTELARACGLSAATVSQQVRLLAAFGIITPEQERRETPGKPKVRYSVAKELGIVAILGRTGAGLRTLTPDTIQQAVMRAWLWNSREDGAFLEKYLWLNEDLVAASAAIAIVDTSGEEMHLLIITDEQRLEHVRKHHSKRVVERPDGSKRTFICWTHTAQELKDGLEHEEAYFLNLFKKHYVVFDREQVLRGLGV